MFSGRGLRLWGSLSGPGTHSPTGSAGGRRGRGLATGLTGAEGARTPGRPSSGGGGAASSAESRRSERPKALRRTGAGLLLWASDAARGGSEATPRWFGKGRGRVPSHSKGAWPRAKGGFSPTGEGEMAGTLTSGSGGPSGAPATRRGAAPCLGGPGAWRDCPGAGSGALGAGSGVRGAGPGLENRQVANAAGRGSTSQARGRGLAETLHPHPRR